jgi:hypothetical protein
LPHRCDSDAFGTHHRNLLHPAPPRLSLHLVAISYFKVRYRSWQTVGKGDTIGVYSSMCYVAQGQKKWNHPRMHIGEGERLESRLDCVGGMDRFLAGTKVEGCNSSRTSVRRVQPFGRPRKI